MCELGVWIIKNPDRFRSGLFLNLFLRLLCAKTATYTICYNFTCKLSTLLLIIFSNYTIFPKYGLFK
nr:MAG TPA: hypothetical protein [Caudoviricetes sp.]DAO73996.1 MAG TPA: hypothetical protein [Caudoviricetes sp.]